jgi:hypothetical protein
MYIVLGGHESPYHLTGLCTLFDVHNELPLTLFKLAAFTVEFSLGLCQRSLVLA